MYSGVEDKKQIAMCRLFIFDSLQTMCLAKPDDIPGP